MPAFIDLTGHKYGKLTVIERAENINGRVAWKCKCDCGKEITTTSNALRTGGTKSCGCLRRAKDLRGQKFGRLTVLYRTGTDKNNGAIWKCKCDCGNIINTCGSRLKNGTTKSCGCLQKEKVSAMASTRKQDLTGQKFGRWTVIKTAGTKHYSSGDKQLWLCRCECGTEKIIEHSSLTTGHSTSCGCYAKEQTILRSRKTIASGTRFGKLTVIEYDHTEGKISYYRCKCDCGNEKIVSRNHLKTGGTKSCGCLKSSGEQKIQNLLSQYNFNFNTQYYFKDCKTEKRPLYFDFYINNSYLIEYDGEQHFKSIEFFGGEEQLQLQKQYDKVKNEYCKIHNIPLIRIPYWHYDKITIDDLRPETSQFLI